MHAPVAAAARPAATAIHFQLAPDRWRPDPGSTIRLQVREWPGGKAVELPAASIDRCIARCNGNQWLVPGADGGLATVCAEAGRTLFALSTTDQLHLKLILPVAREGEPVPAAAGVMGRVTQELEITPLVDPSAMPPVSDLPLRVHYQGPALAGAEVLAFAGDEAAPRLRTRTDGSGVACLRIGHGGTWLLAVAHAGHRASLAFLVEERR